MRRTKIDYDKLGFIEKSLFLGMFIFGLLFIISVVLAIWWEPFPGTKAILSKPNC